MINIAICDDEPFFAREIQKVVYSFSIKYKLELSIDIFYSGESLIKVVKTRPAFYKCIFLDIIMPEMDGLECAREIRKTNQDVDIVFVTSTPDFALDGYNVSAKQYILKPINEEELSPILRDIFFKKDEYFNVHLGYHNYKTVLVKSILYFESNGRKVTIYYENDTSDEMYGKLSECVDNLSTQVFNRCHHSYIVNLDAVKEIRKNTLYLYNGKELPVSRAKKSDLIEQYLENLALK